MKYLKSILLAIAISEISCQPIKVKEEYYFDCLEVNSKDILVRQVGVDKTLWIGDLIDEKNVKKGFSDYFIRASDFDKDRQFKEIHFKDGLNSFEKSLNLKKINFIYRNIEKKKPDLQLQYGIYPMF